MSVADNVARVLSMIEEARGVGGQTLPPVSLLLASKTVDCGRIIEALRGGARIFGESYVQESQKKIAEVFACAEREGYTGEKRPKFHFIGALQRNKVRLAVQLFDVIESVDRAVLAKEIAKQASLAGKVQSVLVQVNISRESSKSGVAPEKVVEFCRLVSEFDSLSLEGLMTIGRYYPPGVEVHAHRAQFSEMKRLRDMVSGELSLPLPVLSMGMSEDFQMAIEEGATEVRLGTAVFGERAV